jgi:hypothetical protein
MPLTAHASAIQTNYVSQNRESRGVAIDDWAEDNLDHSNLNFIGGGISGRCLIVGRFPRRT